MIRTLMLLTVLFFTNLLAAEECAQGENCSVGVKTFVFFDKSRERPIITEVYYPPGREAPHLEPSSNNFRLLKEVRNAPIPKSSSKMPLIILSHGHQGDRFQHAWLQEFLAANGYIVAVPDHYGNTSYMQRAEDSLKRWDRPKDITFLIDRLLETPSLKALVDPTRIGFIGYSHGGLTGVWLAGGIARDYPTPDMATSPLDELDEGTTQAIIEAIDFEKAGKTYEDKRVKAAFLMAPSYGKAFDAAGLSPIEIPMTIVTTAEDQVTPFSENAKFYVENIKSAALKVLPGKAGHYVYLNATGEGGKNRLPLELTQDDPAVNRYEVHEEIATKALKFFNKYLKGETSSATTNQSNLKLQ